MMLYTPMLREHRRLYGNPTDLQMGWVAVTMRKHAQLNEKGEFIKVPGEGVTEGLWTEMTAYAQEKGFKGGNYKKLNLPFENRLAGQPGEVRKRMAEGVEAFVFELLSSVFNAVDTAPLAIQAILSAGSYDLGAKATRIDDPAEWTESKIRERAAEIGGDKAPAGDFDD